MADILIGLCVLLVISVIVLASLCHRMYGDSLWARTTCKQVLDDLCKEEDKDENRNPRAKSGPRK